MLRFILQERKDDANVAGSKSGIVVLNVLHSDVNILHDLQNFLWDNDALVGKDSGCGVITINVLSYEYDMAIT